jgi:hypothetical protein
LTQKTKPIKKKNKGLSNLTDTENKTHQKKNNKNKKTKVQAVLGNYPDRQTHL